MEATLVVYNNTMTFNIHLFNILVIKNRIICWLYYIKHYYIISTLLFYFTDIILFI